MERRGRKKQELKNHAIHRELMDNFNFNSKREREKEHNIFEVLSEYDIVFDDIKKIKLQTKRQQTTLFSCSKNIREELSRYADLFSSKILTVKKIDIINYILGKIFDSYSEEELIEMVENSEQVLNSIGEEEKVSCYLEKSLLDKVFSVKRRLREKKQKVPGFKIISLFLEVGKNEYLPKLKK